MIDSTTEHPELIWNEDTRNGVYRLVNKNVAELAVAQAANPDVKWNAVCFTLLCHC